MRLTGQENRGIITQTAKKQCLFGRMKGMKIMNEKKIKLMATEDAQEFVMAAGKCDFDIDVLYQRAMVDAKSILGVLSLGLCKELTVKYWGDDRAFESVVQKYAAM